MIFSTIKTRIREFERKTETLKRTPKIPISFFSHRYLIIYEPTYIVLWTDFYIYAELIIVYYSFFKISIISSSYHSDC